MASASALAAILFQSTLPVRGATVCPEAREHVASDFNPRSPCGERRFYGDYTTEASYFNPRSPCGERRHLIHAATQPEQFQSTLPVRGATSPRRGHIAISGYFNPRSPCGERRQTSACQRLQADFNPRSPCGERLGMEWQRRSIGMISIHAPRAGSDVRKTHGDNEHAHFNPRSPCGERPASPRNPGQRWIFQSTLPVRGATKRHIKLRGRN